MYYVCKMCGRSMWHRTETPVFCYFDRSDLMENISPNDAKTMGIDFIEDEYIIAAAEFPGDIRYDVMTGDKVKVAQSQKSLYTLASWQRSVMEMVYAS